MHWSLKTLLAISALSLGCQRTPSRSGDAPASPSPESGGLSRVLNVFKPEPVVIPEGTRLLLVLETSLSSATHRPGDAVLARLAADVRQADRVLLPSGSEVRGQVTAAVPSSVVKGQARLAVDFDRIVVKGREYPIETQAVDISAPSTKKRNVAIVGGGTGAGALIGALVGGKKGAGIGALVGAGAGVGVVAAEKGKEVQLPAGTEWTVRLVRPARLE